MAAQSTLYQSFLKILKGEISRLRKIRDGLPPGFLFKKVFEAGVKAYARKSLKKEFLEVPFYQTRVFSSSR